MKPSLKKDKNFLFSKRLDLKKISEKKLNQILTLAKREGSVRSLTVGFSFTAILLLSGGVVAAQYYESFREPKGIEVKEVIAVPLPSATPSPSVVPTDTEEIDSPSTSGEEAAEVESVDTSVPQSLPINVSNKDLDKLEKKLNKIEDRSNDLPSEARSQEKKVEEILQDQVEQILNLTP